MTEVLHERLASAKESVFRLDKAERRRDELHKRIREKERLIVQLELRLEAEQADVDQLMRMSLVNLFHTILRSKEEQLELERQQALAAALKLQEAKQALERYKAELAEVGDELADLRDARRDYAQAMAEKEAALRSSPGDSAELDGMEGRIADQTLWIKEVHEAWMAGKRVLATLEDASASLGKAEGWGNWDMWGGGGLISTHIKHSHIDEAKRFIHNANHLMYKFRDELADLQRTVDIRIDISGMLKMADYWFDGFITDWVVQGRIKNAQEQTLAALHKVRTAVNQLQAEHADAESALAVLQAARVAWIEGRKTQQ